PVHASLLLGCATMGTAFVPAAHWVGQGGSGRRRLALAGRRVELVCCWNRVPERPPVRDKGAKLPSAMSPHRAASEGRVTIPAKPSRLTQRWQSSPTIRLRPRWPGLPADMVAHLPNPDSCIYQCPAAHAELG